MFFLRSNFHFALGPTSMPLSITDRLHFKSQNASYYVNSFSRPQTLGVLRHLVPSRFAYTANGWPVGVPLKLARHCPEAPRGQQPWRTHCLLDLGLTCVLLAAGCDPGLPTLLRDIRQNETGRFVLTDNWINSYRKYDVVTTGSTIYKQKYCLKHLVTEYRLRVGVGNWCKYVIFLCLLYRTLCYNTAM